MTTGSCKQVNDWAGVHDQLTASLTIPWYFKHFPENTHWCCLSLTALLPQVTLTRQDAGNVTSLCLSALQSPWCWTWCFSTWVLAVVRLPSSYTDHCLQKQGCTYLGKDAGENGEVQEHRWDFCTPYQK